MTGGTRRDGMRTTRRAAFAAPLALASVTASGGQVSAYGLPSGGSGNADLDEARAYRQDGDYRNAYLAFQLAIRNGPDASIRSAAALEAAESLLTDDRPDEAVEALDAWIDTFASHPRQYVARVLRARALQASSRPQAAAAAVEAWREVLFVGAVPCADAVRVRLANHLFAIGRDDEGWAELEVARSETSGTDAPAAAKLLVLQALMTRADARGLRRRADDLSVEALDASIRTGRLPEDVATAAWRVVSAAVASGDAALADQVRWRIVGDWPDTHTAAQAVTELGPTRVPATIRARVAAANGNWAAVRDAAQWVIANAPSDPEVGAMRALLGVAMNALDEPGVLNALEAGGQGAGGPQWGARALWEAAEIRRANGEIDRACVDYSLIVSLFPETLHAGQARYRLGRLLPASGDVIGATKAMNLAADTGPVGFHTVRARQILHRQPSRAPRGTAAFAAAGAITDTDWAEWTAWLVARKIGTPTDGDLSQRDIAVAIGRLDALLACGLTDESEDAAREICSRRDFAFGTIAAVADRLKSRGNISFSMTLGHRLIRALEAVGETSTLSLPAVPRKLAYPLAYARLVSASAAREGVDPFLLLGLMKQESWFIPHAASTASARGLTQFIRQTAQGIAKELSWPNWSWDDMFRPYVSVPFGARYLANLIKEYAGNTFLATAAYNAGPGPISRWSGGDPTGDPDQFVDAITYRETRAYVKNVATYAEVYRDTYGTT